LEDLLNFAGGLGKLLFALRSAIVFEVIFCGDELIDTVVKCPPLSVIPEVV